MLEPKKKKLMIGEIPGLKTYKKVERFEKPQKTDRIETKSHLPTPTKQDKDNTVKVNSLMLELTEKSKPSKSLVKETTSRDEDNEVSHVSHFKKKITKE